MAGRTSGCLAVSSGDRAGPSPPSCPPPGYGACRDQGRATEPAVIRAAATAAKAIIAFPLLIIVLATASPGTPAQVTSNAADLVGEPNALARADIPPVT